MFKRKENKSLVQRLKEEVGRTRTSPIDDMGFFSFAPFFVDVELDENRKMFAELLSNYIEDKIEEDYTECSDCGCLIADEKVQYVARGSEKIPYCKHCKPDYDEIVTEYDDDECEMRDAGYRKNGVVCDEKGKIKA
ncbi:MAG: hypothetical protein PHE21_00180 [Candidatus Dojkabacteria bacterium]|nr:hypothetical protein [Candidatus Dojkabacteria bacterium]